MELSQYLRLFRKWAWLIAVAAFVGGGLAYIDAVRRPTTYRAETTISIGGYIDQPNPTQYQIWTGRDLATTYAQLVRTFSILQSTIDELGLAISPDSLFSAVSTQIIDGTSLLIIGTTYEDPVVAADIANTIAEQIILQSPSNLTADQRAQIDFANSQIDDLNAQLQEARDHIELLDAQLGSGPEPGMVATLTAQRSALIDQVNDAAATIATFSSNVTALQQRTNVIDIVEPARIPILPVGGSPIRAALIGAVLGAALAVGLVLLIEYLDDKVRTAEQTAEVLQLPVLAAIQEYGSKDHPYSDMLVPTDTWSPAAEGYRVLRTNLLFTTASSYAGPVYVVTSAGPEEGKTVVVANLAASMAQAGMNILLVDADLRRPRIHEIFGLPNQFGLTNLLFADPSGKGLATGSDVEESIIRNALRTSVQQTAIPRLRVITSGFIPSNPAEILGSALMRRWTEVFLTSFKVDAVLFDTAPALIAADTAVLVKALDANVLFVLNAGQTRIAAARRIREQFDLLDVKVRGVVLNRVNPREEHYRYGHGYEYYYSATPQPNGRVPGVPEGVH